ncbi:AmmeMemoRadiSam system radical SAM enzyme [candidate division WOR-3 bacterium]|uniref:AmmeMemoRadiSam system radical SAM enzyme n=1 Tax=candidate division WOR-3 bacterium TaxID=2052148 RepID=A0A938BU20_UNCW3|nr:AmmeMemoRadiSam system radical SAM enzyme [candidate division WOR-3 bacterium]
MVKSAALFVLAALLLNASAPGTRASSSPTREAEYYRRLDNKLVACDLCPRRCVIQPGGRGACRVRENRDGRLYSVVYGRPCSVGKEPIEKAPFFHFLPGRQRLTIATAGCNQSCKYCQNWELSQARPEEVQNHDLSPAEVVALAVKEKAPIICFTYTEPVVFYEYVMDIARLARAQGIRTAVVTGAYVNPEPLRELCSAVDAIKIDLKGFTPEFYRNVCGSTLEPVLEACRTVAQSGTHLELVNLVVPALNDDTATIRKMCRWIRENVGDTVPVHFTRFHPDYRLQNSPPTPTATLEGAVAIARSEHLQFTYVGNVPGHQAENTCCPACGRTLVRRSGYSVVENRVKDGKCPFCGVRVAGVWQ